MAADITQVVSAQIERVRNKLETYFETSDQISGLIKKAGEDKVKVSRKLYRIPFQQWRGGVLKKVSMDNGALPTGNGMKISHLTAGYYTTDLAYTVTDEQIDTTGDKTQAVVNVFQKTLADAMLEAQVYDDVAFHGNGTGLLTAASSAKPSATTLTFAGASDYLGVGRLREGMTVDVWDGSSTNRGSAQITNIDYGNKIVTLDNAVSGLASGDLLAFHGMDVYGPAYPASFSSTWPGDALTNSAGLTGDSFRHGFPYANDATVSNYYLGTLKSTISQLLPAYANAAAGSLVLQHGLQVIDQILQRRDPDVVKGLVGIAHMAQRAQVMNIGIAVSNWQRSSGSEKNIDLMPKNIGYTDTFEFCGIKCYLSKRQDRSRFDFINPKNWGRVMSRETAFKEVGGQTVFPVFSNPSSTTVSMNTAVQFHILQGYDFCCYDPGAGGYIYGLSLPSGY